MGGVGIFAAEQYIDKVVEVRRVSDRVTDYIKSFVRKVIPE